MVVCKEKEVANIKTKLKELEGEIVCNNKVLDDKVKSFNHLKDDLNKVKSQLDDANLKVSRTIISFSKLFFQILIWNALGGRQNMFPSTPNLSHMLLKIELPYMEK